MCIKYINVNIATILDDYWYFHKVLRQYSNVDIMTKWVKATLRTSWHTTLMPHHVVQQSFEGIFLMKLRADRQSKCDAREEYTLIKGIFHNLETQMLFLLTRHTEQVKDWRKIKLTFQYGLHPLQQIWVRSTEGPTETND